MESILAFLKPTGLLIAALSILVVLHELGHYLPAVWSGMRVEKFYLFFDWPRKLWSITVKGTEYGIGLLPFGGYVKISGIVDESMDTSHVGTPPQPHEFRSKSVWARMAVMVGGVTVNVLLGIAIYSMIAGVYGKPFTKLDSLKYGLYFHPDSPYRLLGLENGDQVKAINGQPVQYLQEVASPSFALSSDVTITVLRDGKELTLNVPNEYLNTLSGIKKMDVPFVEPNLPNRLEVPDSLEVSLGKKVPNELPGAKAGLKTGDFVLAVDTLPVRNFGDLKVAISARANQTVQLTVLRGQDTLLLPVTLDETAKLGVLSADTDFVETERETYGFFAAIGAGTVDAFTTVGDQLRGLGKVFRGEADVRKSVGGPVKIAQQYDQTVSSAGWLGFWWLTGMLSMWLAFVNILPIPALDGGHLVFLLIEAVTGREPSLKVRMIAQQIGFFLLLSLMALIILNDFF